MDSRCYNNSANSRKRKRQALRTLTSGVVFFAVLFVITRIYKRSLCPIKSIFGVACPGCGLTRGFSAILRFDFGTAQEYNVLSIPLFICIALYAVFCVTDYFFDTDYIAKIEAVMSKKYMCAVYTFLLALSCVINNL